MKSRTQKIVMASMLAAVVCVATMIIKIPSPRGYINIGDSVVLLSGWLLSPLYGFLAAGVGSALADLFLGYALYAPVTFFVKGIMAFLAYHLFKVMYKKMPKLPARIITGVLAEIFMSIGYYIFEGFLYGFIPALSSMPGNLIQGTVGLIIGILLIGVFERNKIMQ